MQHNFECQHTRQFKIQLSERFLSADVNTTVGIQNTDSTHQLLREYHRLCHDVYYFNHVLGAKSRTIKAQLVQRTLKDLQLEGGSCMLGQMKQYQKGNMRQVLTKYVSTLRSSMIGSLVSCYQSRIHKYNYNLDMFL